MPDRQVHRGCGLHPDRESLLEWSENGEKFRGEGRKAQSIRGTTGLSRLRFYVEQKFGEDPEKAEYLRKKIDGFREKEKEVLGRPRRVGKYGQLAKFYERVAREFTSGPNALAYGAFMKEYRIGQAKKREESLYITPAELERFSIDQAKYKLGGLSYGCKSGERIELLEGAYNALDGLSDGPPGGGHPESLLFDGYEFPPAGATPETSAHAREGRLSLLGWVVKTLLDVVGYE